MSEPRKITTEGLPPGNTGLGGTLRTYECFPFAGLIQSRINVAKGTIACQWPNMQRSMDR